MAPLLHDEPTFSERFISYMLARNLRIEADHLHGKVATHLLDLAFEGAWQFRESGRPLFPTGAT